MNDAEKSVVKKATRLYGGVIPIRYGIVIKPNLSDFTFSGSEKAQLKIVDSASTVKLHSKNIKITKPLCLIEDSAVDVVEIVYDEEDETVSFILSREVSGQITLSFDFTGLISDDMRGFYRSRYTHNGEEKWIATTQFEATDARRAFPCIDEPAAKAIFDITIIAPADMKVISNTMETSVSEDEAGLTIVQFEPTPMMSTYLVAFIVGDFEYIEKKTEEGVLVRVFVTPGKKDQAQFALDVACRCLSFYTKYFDIAYPLPVLDMIALPDFASGAMENWGAVTYREIALLVDDNLTSVTLKQWAALVICHELAHQWFGNLVTMDWWTDLWLNEGFATYIEYVAVDDLFPDWDIWTQFTYRELNYSLELDALKSTHPIEVEVHHPDEIREIFDGVSYAKGASVIRMLATYLGAEDFKNGLRHYLKKHSYGNTITIDLWDAFEYVSGKPVKMMMERWTQQAGHPVVAVGYEDGEIVLSQSRFFKSAVVKSETKDNSLWPIPVSYTTNHGLTVEPELFEGKNSLFAMLDFDFIKINTGETGVYRSVYNDDLLSRLRPAVRSGALPSVDRLGIVRDLFSAAMAGEAPTTQALILANDFVDEKNFVVWSEVLSSLGSLYQLLALSDCVDIYKKFVNELLVKIRPEVGWDKKSGEAHATSLLRTIVLAASVRYGDAETISRALEYFKNENIHADVRSVVYTAVAQKGKDHEHQEFMSRYVGTDNTEERARLGRALGQFNDANLLRKTLDLTLSSSVRKQDAAGVIAGVYANPLGRAVAWEWTKENWDKICSYFDNNAHMLEDFVDMMSVFQDRITAREVADLFGSHASLGSSRALTQALESIYAREAWYAKDADQIALWLKDRYSV